MIISVEELRTFITTDKSDHELELITQALESAIIKETNNNFKDGYPADVKQAVIDIINWKLRNEELNGLDTSKKAVQSETLSRHSVTYAQDTTEADIDVRLGVPKKYVSIIKRYKKARF